MAENVLNKDIVLKDSDGTQLWPLAHRDSGGYIIEETYLKNYVVKDGVRYNIDPTNLMYLAESSEGNIITTITGEDITIVEAVLYGISSTSTTEPETWSDTIPDPIPDGWYLWTKTVYANGATSYNISYKGKDGINGSPAYKYSIDSSVDSIIFDVNANRLVPSTVTFNFTVATGEGTPTPFNGYYTIQTSQNGEVYVNSTSGTGTTVNYSPQSTAIKFIQCKLFASSSETDPLDVETIAVISDGLNGAAGITIRSVEEWYTLTQSETPVPDPESSEWDWVMGGAGTSLPVMTQTDKYLWNYEKVNYSNNTSFISEPVIIGAYGDTGRGIKSITNYYLATSITDPTELPEPVSETSDPEWYDTPQQISETNKYLWNYEEIIYIDDSGETIVNTDPAVIGMFSKDGTNGTDAYTVIITNENHTFPASSNGHAIASSTTGSIVAYKGYTRIATDVGTIPTVSGLTFSIAGDNTTNTTYTVTADSNLASSGSVTIPVIVDSITFNLVFSYSLAVPGINGEDAIIYYLQPSVNAINIDQDNNYVPSLFTLNGFKQVGNNSPTAYAGRFEVDSTTDFINWNYFAGQSQDTSSLQVSLSTLSHSVVALRCRLYESLTPIPASSSATPLDTQTLLFVHEGKDSYNISFDNDTLTFAGTDTAAVPGSETTYINAYRGTTRVAATLSTQGITGKPEGMTITVNNSPDSSYPGSTITVTVSSTMTSQTGTLYIPATVDSQVFMIPLRYILTLKGTNGTDGVSPTIYSVAPSYNYILVDKNNNVLPSDTVYFSAYAQTGTVKASYPSIFKLYTKPLYTGDVPENYNEYEWINPKGQIRLTGIKTNQDTKIESKWYRTTNSAQYIYLSDSNSSGSTNTTAYLSSSGGNWRFGNRTISINPAVATVITSVQDRTGIILNNSSAGTYNTVSNFTSTDDLKIAASGAGNVRYYYLRVYDNTTLVADLVPVERKSDHEFGFYDKVSGTFFHTPGIEVTHGDLIPQQSSGQLDSEGWLLVYTSASEEENCSYFISSKNISGIKAEIYKNNALLDSESIPVIFEPQDGVSGIGINSVSVMYAIVDDLADIESSQTEWSSTMPTSVEQGKYLVVRTITDYTDPSVADTIEYSYSYESIDGLDGLDGTSVTVGTIEYRVGDSATQHPTTGWQITVPSTQPGEYLWTRTELIEGEGSSMISRYIYSVAYQGTNGQNGQNGQSVFIRYSNNSTGNPMLPEGQIGKYIGIHVGDSVPADYTGYAPWVQLEGTNGEDGAVPTGTSIQYAQTATKVNPENISDWSNTMPDPTPNYYMWTKITITYSLGNPSVIYNMAKNGQNGADGKGISNVTEYYKATSTTSTPGDTGWTENSIPSDFNETNKYLWNYEIISYTVGNNTVTPKAIVGVYGKDGKGISSITDWYLATNISNVNNLPTLGQSPWTTTVQTADSTHKYLWNYEVIDWTEGQDTVTTPVIIGNWSKDGDTGRSITDITEYYAASDTDVYSSELVLNWGTVISDLNPRFSEDYPYLWNYELIDFNPGPDSRTPPQVISVYGQTGPAGVGISDITEYYLASNSTTTPSKESSEWGENVPTIDKNKPYLWNYELITFTEGEPWSSEPAIISRYSTSGSQIWTSETAPSGANNTFNISDLQGDSSASVKVGDIVFYGSNRYTITAVGSTTVNCGIVESIKGATGEAGYSNATVYLYKRGATAPATPTGTFTYTFSTGSLEGKSGTNPDLKNWVRTPNAAPADSENNPLWVTLASASSNYDADDILQNEWQTPIQLEGINGVDGTDGISIGNIKEYYKASSSNTNPGTTGWTDDPTASAAQMTATKQYLWNYEEIKDTNNNIITTTSPAIIGRYGQNGSPGQGINGIKEFYGRSTSSTSQPTSWTEVPGTGSTPNSVPVVDAVNKYLWNYEQISWINPVTTTNTTPAIVGVYGDGGEVYTLIVSDNAIVRDINSSNTLTPEYITLSATKQVGGNTPTSYSGYYVVSEYYNNNWHTIEADNNSRYYINSRSSSVKAELKTSSTGPVVDSQTIPVIDSGENATPVYNAWLSNENHTFSGDKDGIPIKINNVNQSTTSTIYIYKGTTRLTTLNVTIPSTQGLTITRSGTVLTVTASGTTAQTKPAESGTVNISVEADGETFSLPFSYSISKVGATGLAGYNQATIYLYRRSGSRIEEPADDDLSYNFETGELSETSQGSGVLDIWSREIPDGPDPCYVTSVSVLSRDPSIVIKGWADSVKLVQDGTNGNKGNTVAIVNIYKRAANKPTAGPTSDLTYTFGTNKLSTSGINGWSQLMPTDDGNPCWMLTATANSNDPTDTITTIEWQPRSNNTVDPILIVESGSDGKSVSSVTEYYLASASNSGITTSTPGWTANSIPSNYNETNKYLWNYTKSLYDDGTTANETAPGIIATWSKDGNGISSIIEYYKVTNSTTAPAAPYLESGGTINVNGWSTTPGTTISSNRYLWNCEAIIYTVLDTVITTPAIIGTHSEDVITYSVYCSDSVIIKDVNASSNNLSPSQITVYATKQVNSGTPSQTSDCNVYLYPGYYNNNVLTWLSTSLSPTSSGGTTYNVPSTITVSGSTKTVVKLKAVIKKSGTELDSQIIPYVETGENGSDATPTYTAFLNNENHTFAASYISSSVNGYIESQTTVISEIFIYRGSERINLTSSTAATFTPSSVAGMTLSNYVFENNSNNYNKVSFTAAQGYNLLPQGTITVNVTVDEQSFPLVFSYSKAIRGTAAINQALVPLYTKSSNITTSGLNVTPENIKYTFSTGATVASSSTSRTGASDKPFRNKGWTSTTSTQVQWYRDVPEGDNVCYITTGVAIAQGTQAEITSWSTPQVYIKNGEKGDSAYNISLQNANISIRTDASGAVSTQITEYCIIQAIKGSTLLDNTHVTGPSSNIVINGNNNKKITISRNDTGTTPRLKVVVDQGFATPASGAADIPISVDGIAVTLQISYIITKDGEKGSTGNSVVNQRDLFLLHSSESQTTPPRPDREITATGNDLDTWYITPPEYRNPVRKDSGESSDDEPREFNWDDYEYFIYWKCTQTKFSDGTNTWCEWGTPYADEQLNSVQKTAIETDYNFITFGATKTEVKEKVDFVNQNLTTKISSVESSFSATANEISGQVTNLTGQVTNNSGAISTLQSNQSSFTSQTADTISSIVGNITTINGVTEKLGTAFQVETDGTYVYDASLFLRDVEVLYYYTSGATAPSVPDNPVTTDPAQAVNTWLKTKPDLSNSTINYSLYYCLQYHNLTQANSGSWGVVVINKNGSTYTVPEYEYSAVEKVKNFAAVSEDLNGRKTYPLILNYGNNTRTTSAGQEINVGGALVAWNTSSGTGTTQLSIGKGINRNRWQFDDEDPYLNISWHEMESN